ncbi:DMT family transporter [Curvivirga aplysinae]|uniref:DMT family transporter n=1 Tax=Curvivirga aplysinae TaxID=2529852 RepID=UPI0012BD4EB9|nr:DMT family transporter [Curvivirga aplysinae]MTI11206.1 EamA family transporter [Curvivirga aplysinae]
MQNAAFYLLTILIWGSSWFVITFQLGEVHPVVSVAYRFALAGVILFAFVHLFSRKKEEKHLSVKDHLFMAAQGLMLFSFNYSTFYVATGYLPSGLVAVVFCTISILNIVNQAIFFKKKVDGRVLIASILGLFGIGLVFLPEVQVLSFEDDSMFGLALCLLATLFASFGNMLAMRNNNAGISVNTYNKWGMTYGAIGSFVIVLLAGIEFKIDTSFDYLWSLFYLAAVASVIAFGCYLTLVKNIGADRAAYVAVLFPIVALGISTFYEGYVWTLEALAGVVFILVGNMLVISKPGQIKKWLRLKAS